MQLIQSLGKMFECFSISHSQTASSEQLIFCCSTSYDMTLGLGLLHRTLEMGVQSLDPFKKIVTESLLYDF
jgi:hypothetical protein